MSILNNSLLLGADAGAVEYQIQRSLRFNSSDSAYLSRTPASAGNRKTWTWSAWAKPSNTDASGYFLFNAGGASNNSAIAFTNGTIDVYFFSGGGYVWRLNTSAVYRDFSAWYHIVFALDTSQATSSDRAKLYVNGTQVTVFSSALYPTLNYEGPINTAVLHNISGLNGANGFYYNGYLADIHFIDGQALTPSSFAETNITTGQWVPKAFTGTYGTHGFRLAFADNSNNTATTLGKDSSPNGNNWTPNNLSVTAGAGNDSLVDTPTSYGTDTGAGGEVRGNYCTLNPLIQTGSSLANGNLDYVSAGTFQSSYGSVAVSNGKWYFEAQLTAFGVDALVGVGYGVLNTGTYVGGTATSWGYESLFGRIYNNATFTSFGSTYAPGDIIGVAFDADTGKLWFAKNNVWQASGNPSTGSNPAVTLPTGFSYLFGVSGGDTSAWVCNFGQRQFVYTAPTAFKAVCDTNLSAPAVAKPNSVFDVKLYSGNGSSQTISGLGFSPDLVWTKSRSNGGFFHRLQDTVRGATKELYSNSTNAEGTNANSLTAFNSDGFTLGSESGINGSGETFVAWAWDAGSSTVTNTQGSITSQVRANPTAGFSIATYSGNGISGASVGHGLGVAPSLIAVKNRTGGSFSWVVYAASEGATKYLSLNQTITPTTLSTIWNNTAPSSSVFTIGDDLAVNSSGGTYVAYCFARVTAYSSFGTFTTNGLADNAFIYTDFRPRWFLWKRTDSANSWGFIDTARDPFNTATKFLVADTSAAESAAVLFDIVSNGIKVRDSGFGNASTFIYAAFAESPFQYTRAR